jgi:hypothetical protein
MAKRGKEISRRRPPKKSTRPYRVFISHATTDKYLARVLCEKLEQRGATTFRDDRDIDGGDDIPDSIKAEIGRCDEFVVLLTPQSVTRNWVLLEVGAAWMRKLRIVVILYLVQIDPIPAILKSKRVFGLNDLDQYLDEVENRAKEHIK